MWSTLVIPWSINWSVVPSKLQLPYTWKDARFKNQTSQATGKLQQPNLWTCSLLAALEHLLVVHCDFRCLSLGIRNTAIATGLKVGSHPKPLEDQEWVVETWTSATATQPRTIAQTRQYYSLPVRHSYQEPEQCTAIRVIYVTGIFRYVPKLNFKVLTIQYSCSRLKANILPNFYWCASKVCQNTLTVTRLDKTKGPQRCWFDVWEVYSQKREEI